METKELERLLGEEGKEDEEDDDNDNDDIVDDDDADCDESTS